MVEFSAHLPDVLHGRISGEYAGTAKQEGLSEKANAGSFSFPELPLDFDFGAADLFADCDSDSDISSFLDHFDTVVAETGHNKRKSGDQSEHDVNACKKSRGSENFKAVPYPQSTALTTTVIFKPNFFSSSLYTGHDSPQSDSETAFSTPENTGSDTRPSSPCADSLNDFDFERTTEYHFQKIQEHAQLAIEALRKGNYGHDKNIVTWAHELKNKTAHELKKETELAWEANKQDKAAVPRPLLKKHFPGTTKRVEQFRKNMRRWMIGTHVHGVGVDWMVYARMEHLVAIAAFLLGDMLPADPASPTAVAESISKYLGKEMPAEFINAELAEPEPGKRYSIGQGLAPHLQAKIQRKVPTLAFSMPLDGEEVALGEWLGQLKALFPKRPAPKSKSLVKA